MFLLRVGLYQNRYDGQYWRMFYQHLKQNIFLPKQIYFMYKSRYLLAFGRQIGEVTNIWLWVTKKTSSSLFSTTVRRDLQQSFVNRNINYSFFFWGIILPRSINLLREILVSNRKNHTFHGLSSRGNHVDEDFKLQLYKKKSVRVSVRVFIQLVKMLNNLTKKWHLHVDAFT